VARADRSIAGCAAIFEDTLGTPAIPRETIERHAQTIAGIVTLSRSRNFAQFCQAAQLGTFAADIATSPNMFRNAIKYARRFQPNVHRSRVA
jgi:hypothetical protein